MTNNTHKARAINRRAIVARYDGKCPYPRCQSHGEIRANQDYIVNGPLGWGHAECVNAKIHFRGGGGASLCGTTQNQRIVNEYDGWSDVTCKKCLKMKDTQRYIDSIVETIDYGADRLVFNSKIFEVVNLESLKYHVEELKKFGIDKSDQITRVENHTWRVTLTMTAKTDAYTYTLTKHERESGQRTIVFECVAVPTDEAKTTLRNWHYTGRESLEAAIKWAKEVSELEEDSVPKFERVR